MKIYKNNRKEDRKEKKRIDWERGREKGRVGRMDRRKGKVNRSALRKGEGRK